MSAAVAVPALLPAVFAAIPVQRDLLVFFLPMKIFLGRSLRAGDLPLWDPFTENGLPFMANLQSQVFYLPNVLTSVLPIAFGYAAYGAFHLVAAALGMYAWARAYRLSRNAAAVAGLAYALGGPLVAAIEFSSILAVAPWIPWSCWAAVRFARDPRPATLATYVTTIALLGLGGEPHTALGGAVMAFLFGWLAAGDDPARGPSGRQRAVLLAAGGVLGGALIAFQLLPFAELVAHSDRRGGLPLELAAMHSVTGGDIAGLLAPEPGAFGLEGGRGQAYLRLQYQGVVTLLAAIAALWGLASAAVVERRVVTLAGAVFAAGWLLAAGDRLPLFTLLHGSGLLATMRYPVKFILPVSAALALLAAFGVARMKPGKPGLPATSLGIALICGVSFAMTGDAGWLHGALFALLTAFLLWRGPDVPRLVVPLLAVDLLLAYALIHPTLPVGDVLADFEAARTVRAAEGRVYTRPYTRQDMDREAALMRDGDSFLLARSRVEGLMGNLPMAFGVRAVRGGPAIRLQGQSRLLEQADRGPAGLDLLRTAAAGYFLSNDPVALAALRPAGAAGPPHLYRIAGALPRSYLACGWRTATATDDPPPEVVGGAVVLVEPADASLLPTPSAPGPGSPAAVLADDAVTVIRDEPDRRDFAVRAPAPCVLVLVESHYPGWVVEVDGAAAPLMRVNGRWMGVPVPAGEVQVSFAFRPRSLRTGVLVSLAALLLTGLWARRLAARS